MKPSNASVRSWLLALSAGTVLASTLTVQAVEYTWDSAATAGIQTGAGNWATTATTWTIDGGVTRIGWPNTGTDSVILTGAAALTLNSTDIQLDDFTTTYGTGFGNVAQLNAGTRTLTLTGGTYDGTGTTGSQFNIASGGGFSFAGTAETTQTFLAGNSDIVKQGGGSLFFAAGSINNTFTGNLYINTGFTYVNSGNDTSLGNAENDIHILTGALSAQTNAVTLGSGRTIHLDAPPASNARIGAGVDMTLQGQITGVGSLEKISTAVLTLNATSDYSGTTTISAGALRLGANGTIPSSSNLTINSATGNFNVRNTDNWTYNGIITGDGLGAVNLNSGSNTTLAGNISGVVSVNANSTGTNATVSGAISGAASVNVQNTGNPVLRLSGANTQTGGSTVANNGTLVLDYTSQDNSKLSDIGTLTLSGGTLNLSGGTHPEVVASTILSANTQSDVTRSSGGAVLQMNAITANAGAVVNFSDSNIATTDNTNTAGILGLWATVGGTDFATNATDGPDGSIIAYTGYTDVTNLSSGTKVISDLPTANYRIIQGSGSAGDLTLGAAVTTINTLTQSASGAAITNLGGQTLNVGSILSGTGAGTLTISNGTLSTATPGGNLTLLSHSSSALTISATIADNTTASTLSTGGPGTVLLNGINTYTGSTTILEGTLEIGGAGQLGSGTYAGAIANSGALLYSSSAAQTLSGIISGGGSFTKTNSSTLTLGGANTFSGQLTVQNGILSIDTINNVSAAGRLGNSVLPVILGGSGTTGTLQYTGAVATSTKPFTLASGGSGAFDVTTNALTLSGVINGGGGLIKNGAANLSIQSGAASTIGAITINTGKLIFVGANSLAIGGSGNITVNDGGEFRMQPGLSNTFITARNISIFSTGATPSIATGGGSNGISQLDGTITLNGDTRFQMDGDSVLTTTNSITGTNTNVTVNAGGGAVCNLNGAVSLGTGSITKTSLTGVLVLANAGNMFSGGLKQQGNGGITISAPGAQGSGDITFETGGGGAVNFANVAGTIANNIVSTGGAGGVTKSGAATTVLTGTHTYTGNTTVSGGTLTLGVDNSIPDVSNVVIGNGTLNLPANVNDAAATLDVTNANSTINLGSLATLAFTGGTATWAGTLNITGTFASNSSLRFGTDDTGLTDDQLLLITAPGFTDFDLSPTGYLIATSVGSPYDTWAAQITNGLDLRTDDADGDGFNNLQEFLFGTSPIAGNGALVTTTTSGGNLTLRWLQRESGATYTLKESATLAAESWSPSTPQGAIDGDQTGAPTDYDYFTATLPTSGGKLFFRIEGVEN